MVHLMHFFMAAGHSTIDHTSWAVVFTVIYSPHAFSAQ